MIEKIADQEDFIQYLKGYIIRLKIACCAGEWVQFDDTDDQNGLMPAGW